MKNIENAALDKKSKKKIVLIILIVILLLLVIAGALFIIKNDYFELNTQQQSVIIDDFEKMNGDFKVFDEKHSVVNDKKYKSMDPCDGYVQYAKDLVRDKEEVNVLVLRYGFAVEHSRNIAESSENSGNEKDAKKAQKDVEKNDKQVERYNNCLLELTEANLDMLERVYSYKQYFQMYLEDDSLPSALRQKYQAYYDALTCAEHFLGMDSYAGNLKINMEYLQEAFYKGPNALAELQNMGYDMSYIDDLDSGDTEKIDWYIAQTVENLDQFKNEDGKINWDMEGAAEFRTVLDALYYKKQQLSAPMLLQIDVENSGLTEDNKETLGLFQDWYNAANYVEYLIKIGADTSEIDAAKNDYNQIMNTINEDDLSEEFMISLGINVDEWDEKDINAQIAELKQKIEESIIAVDENGEVIVRPKVKVRS